MKHFRTIAIIWGFIVVLIMPLVLVISRWKNYELFTFQEYIIYLLLFLVLYFMIRDEDRAEKQRETNI